jgi:hypothetical protein
LGLEAWAAGPGGIAPEDPNLSAGPGGIAPKDPNLSAGPGVVGPPAQGPSAGGALPEDSFGQGGLLTEEEVCTGFNEFLWKW